MEESNMREFQSGDKTLKLTARQRAIRDYLEKKLPGSGSIYLGVLFALSDSRNAESIVQAAHSCRELIIKLRPEIPDVAGEAAQGEAYLKVGELSSFYEANPTDRELRDKVEELDRWYKQTQVTRRQKHEEFIEQASESGQPNEKDKKRAARELRDYKDWLSKIAHHGAENVTESDFRKRLQGFEQILEPLIGDYYPVEAEVQKLMMKSDPDESDMRKLRNLFLKPAAASFFFHNAQNCRWLPLLKAEGYFTSPTDIITHEDGTISCPAWPQSSMLSRCVESYPELVSDIIINVEETSNAQVHQELVEIALKLPISLVIEFANKSKEWIRDRYHISPLLPIRLAQLAAKLASAGEEGAGLDMVDTLLDVTIDEEKYRKQTETIGLSLAPQAEAYADDWHYGELLQTLETSTDLRRSKEYVRRLCYKLSKAIRIEHKIRGDDKAETDSTHFARPAIENHEQNSGTDRLKDHLITHIRDRLVELVREGVAVDEIICLLHEFKYPVFRRLEIHLLTEFPDQSRKHIEVLLGNKANFENARVHHELHRLLEKAFGHVSSDIRQGYLDWITAGPDIQQYKDMVRSQTGKEPTQDEARAYVARWKHRKYNPIKAYLNEQHSVELKKLQAEYNTEEHPEFLYYRTSWAGPTSPVDDKELGNRSVLEVLAYLTEWEPPKGHFEPSPEGLGRFFKDDVGNRALEYSQIADRIEPKQLRPVYLYYLFIGFRKSLKDHKEIDWSRVLKLAERIVFAEHLPEPDKSQDDFETGWRGVRKEIGSLISEGLTSADAIPFNMRERIWQLVERLCGDEDPTIEFEAEYGGSNMSPVDMSINTVRGEAVHGLFRYLVWIDKNINKDRAKENQEHSIPSEAIPVLERILDLEGEPTLTIRSIVGWYIQWLASLDLDWTQGQLTKIFPEEPHLRRFRDAALGGYFSVNRPDGYLFKHLRGLYTAGFEWVNESVADEDLDRPQQNFVVHAAEYYQWGLDSFDTDECLAKQLFTKGNVKVRAHTVESIGRSLETLLPVLPDHAAALERLQKLFDWRLSAITDTKLPEAEKQEEMKEFGWWFTYGQMDKTWLLERLLQVLEITGGKIEWGHKVLERLADFIAVNGEMVATAVDMIVRSDPAPWNIEYWKKHLGVLFAAVKASGNTKAWGVCNHTINFLGELGYRDYGGLLTSD